MCRCKLALVWMASIQISVYYDARIELPLTPRLAMLGCKCGADP
jgi:hypothetical protein